MANDYFGPPITETPATKIRSANENSTRNGVEAGFDKLATEAQIKSGNVTFQATDTGAADAYVVATPYVTAYAAGQRVVFIAANTNTGSSVINVAGLGNKSILRVDLTALQAGDITLGSVVELIYDGTQFQIMSQTAGSGGTGAVVASQAEAEALALNTVFMSPLRVGDALSAYGPNIPALATDDVSDTNTRIGIDAMDDAASSGTDATAFGYKALEAATSGNNNSAFGSQALALVTTGANNVAVGRQALTTQATNNAATAIGTLALTANTADFNTAVGYWAGHNVIASTGNTIVGGNAGRTLNANNNTIMGHTAYELGTGANNVVLGAEAVDQGTGGSNGVAIGYQALQDNTASNTVAVGYQALLNNSSGIENTALGYRAGRLQSNATDAANTFIGHQSGTTANNGAGENTGVGAYSLRKMTAGANNTALGAYAGDAISTGQRNTAVGSGAMAGSGPTAAPNDNVAVGYEALKLVGNAGNYNIGVGSGAGDSITTGDGNIAMGYQALSTSNTGSYAVAIGYQAGAAITSTGANGAVAIGYQAGQDLISQPSVLIGYQAGTNITSQPGNTVIGYQAYAGTSTGSYNTVLGHQAMQNASGGAANTNTAIGHSTMMNATTGSDNVAVGYESGKVTTIGLRNVSLGADSMKTNQQGDDNVAAGFAALDALIVGDQNTGLGSGALGAATGSGNVAIGYQAGGAQVGGDDKLFIANSNTATPLIGGDFSAESVTIAGFLGMRDWTLLPSFTVAGEPETAANAGAGAVFYCTNGDTGSPCLAVSNGTNWLRVVLGATISAT